MCGVLDDVHVSASVWGGGSSSDLSAGSSRLLQCSCPARERYSLSLYDLHHTSGGKVVGDGGGESVSAAGGDTNTSAQTARLFKFTAAAFTQE